MTRGRRDTGNPRRCSLRLVQFCISRGIMLASVLTLMFCQSSKDTMDPPRSETEDCLEDAENEDLLTYQGINITTALLLLNQRNNKKIKCRKCHESIPTLDKDGTENTTSSGNNQGASRLLRTLYVYQNSDKTHIPSMGSGWQTDDEDYTDWEGSASGSTVWQTRHRWRNIIQQHKVRKKFLDPEQDNCAKWISCQDPYLQQYLNSLSSLPSCPCIYPFHTNSKGRVWDEHKGRFFLWKDSSSGQYKINVYKKGAKYCIWSRLVPESSVLAAQQCCYDRKSRLITRGVAAGTPNLISPDISKSLHHYVDILPWIICKGDWTRYNIARPPDNARKCNPNPDDREFLRQIVQARQY